MVASTIPKILAQLRAHEGGFVSNPKDPGGATKWGVTHATYDTYRKAHGLPVRSVKDMTDDEYLGVIHDLFWGPMHCDDLPAGVDYAVFDAGWGSGPSKGQKLLQQALGVTVDGKVGPATIEAAAAFPDKPKLAGEVTDLHLAYMRSLSSLWPTFGKGWTTRKTEVKALAMQIAANPDKTPGQVSPPPIVIAPPKPVQPLPDDPGSVAPIGAPRPSTGSSGLWWLVAAALAVVGGGGVAVAGLHFGWW